MPSEEDKPYILIRQLEMEISSLKDDLSTVRQCYYEVINQRNDAIKEISRLKVKLAKRNGIN